MIEEAMVLWLSFFNEGSLPLLGPLADHHGLLKISTNIGVAQKEDLANQNIDNFWAGMPLTLNMPGQ